MTKTKPELDIATVTVTVPVKQVGDHMVTCIESGFEWFVWLNAEREPRTDGRIGGYVSGEFALYDDSVASAHPEVRERALEALKVRKTPIRWEKFRDGVYYPVFAFDHAAFVEGLGRCLVAGLGNGQLAQVQYTGDGEWDIDANGADLVVQLWLFEEVVFG